LSAGKKKTGKAYEQSMAGIGLNERGKGKEETNCCHFERPRPQSQIQTLKPLHEKNVAFLVVKVGMVCLGNFVA